jgi:hypothetical protein
MALLERSNLALLLIALIGCAAPTAPERRASQESAEKAPEDREPESDVRPPGPTRPIETPTESAPHPEEPPTEQAPEALGACNFVRGYFLCASAYGFSDRTNHLLECRDGLFYVSPYCSTACSDDPEPVQHFDACAP